MARILVVDDDEAIRNLYSNALKSAGYQVETATDGDQALLFLEHDSFDLMVTDLKMKRLDGDELARQAKEKWPAMPILMTTGSLAPDDCKADYILPKPCALFDFLDQVKRLLKK